MNVSNKSSYEFINTLQNSLFVKEWERGVGSEFVRLAWDGTEGVKRFYISAADYQGSMLGSWAETLSRNYYRQSTVGVALAIEELIKEYNEKFNTLIDSNKTFTAVEIIEMKEMLLNLKGTFKTFVAGLTLVIGATEEETKWKPLQSAQGKLIHAITEQMNNVAEKIFKDYVIFKMPDGSDIKSFDFPQESFLSQIKNLEVENDNVIKNFCFKELKEDLIKTVTRLAIGVNTSNFHNKMEQIEQRTVTVNSIMRSLDNLIKFQESYKGNFDQEALNALTKVCIESLKYINEESFYLTVTRIQHFIGQQQANLGTLPH